MRGLLFYSLLQTAVTLLLVIILSNCIIFVTSADSLATSATVRSGSSSRSTTSPSLPRNAQRRIIKPGICTTRYEQTTNCHTNMHHWLGLYENVTHTGDGGCCARRVSHAWWDKSRFTWSAGLETTACWERTTPESSQLSPVFAELMILNGKMKFVLQ